MSNCFHSTRLPLKWLNEEERRKKNKFGICLQIQRYILPYNIPGLWNNICNKRVYNAKGGTISITKKKQQSKTRFYFWFELSTYSYGEATNTKYITQLMHNINIKYTKEERFFWTSLCKRWGMWCIRRPE